MKIKFNNVGKISKAELSLDSIAVIAGNNSTGKSTVGKLIYGVYTSLNLLDPIFLLNNKYKTIINELRSFDRWNTLNNLGSSMYTLRSELDNLNNNIRHSEITKDEILTHEELAELESRYNEIVGKIINEISDNSSEADDRQLNNFKVIIDKLNKTLTQSAYDEEVKLLGVQDILLMEFSNSLTSELFPNLPTSINISESNGNEIKLEFKDNRIQVDKSSINVLRDISKTYYIDDPFVLDNKNMMRPVPFLNRNSAYIQFKHRNYLERIIFNRNRERNYYDEKLQSDKINDIFNAVLGGVIDGEKQKFYAANLENPLSTESLSAGMKAFVVIKLLIESGAINDCEFLVLDEPEIHLHPEWQLKYAELIVLIAEHFPIRILITSHSPYFIEAMELYSKKHKMKDSISFYRTIDNPNGESIIKNVTNKLTEIYEDMANPFRLLEELREDLSDE